MKTYDPEPVQFERFMRAQLRTIGDTLGLSPAAIDGARRLAERARRGVPAYVSTNDPQPARIGGIAHAD